MNPSDFYGRRTRPKSVNMPGPSQDISSEDLSVDDDSSISDESFPRGIESHSSSSSSIDTQNTMDDTADDIDPDEGNFNDRMEEVPSDSWVDVSASQRFYSFTGKEELMKKPSSTGPDDSITPFDVYNLFVNDELVAHIVTETNRYADQCIQAKKITRRSRLSQWTPTDAKEVRKFLGLLIVMGLVRKPKMELYWSKTLIYDYPFVYKNMTRDRFSLLLRHFHFNDNTFLDKSNRLYKIEPLVKMLNENFQLTYSPGADLIVDESLIPFRGRVLFRQYIPNKTHKYGVKLYKLCSPNAYT